MAVQLKRKLKTTNHYVTEETDNYMTVRKWLTKINKVVDIDSPKKETWMLCGDCKLIYSYLFNFGKCHGWHSIYPNQDLISRELGIHERTLKRKIKVLCDCGLLDIVRQKTQKGFSSNRYIIKTPKTISRRKWLDIEGNVLTGLYYKFDRKQFNKK